MFANYNHFNDILDKAHSKVARVICLQLTIYVPFALGWDDKSGTLLWSMDTSYTVHEDIYSHKRY